MNRIYALALALVTLIAPLGAQQDKIVSKDGKERLAKISSEDYDGLKLSVEGGSTTIPWRDVDSIRYANATKYHEALDAFLTASAADALEKLQPLAADDKLRPVLRHGVLYHLGLTEERLGNTDEAIQALQTLLTDFPRSRYLVSAGSHLLALNVAKGDPSGAAKFLETTLSSARSGGGAGQASFDFLRGRILEEQKKFADAQRTYEGVSSSGADPELAFAAKLALARCAQKDNKTNDAQRRYRELVTADAPSDVLAGAWNGLGDLALAEAAQKRDQEGMRYALFAYLRGVVLYVPDRRGSSEEYERALAGAAKAFKGVGELDSDAARKKTFLTRAQQLRAQLAAEYPRSRHLEGL